jgi:H+/gluconate symporter-like permease
VGTGFPKRSAQTKNRTGPHNGAVVTLLAVTGLTHRQAYKDVFVITLTKTAAVFVAIAFFYLTGVY